MAGKPKPRRRKQMPSVSQWLGLKTEAHDRRADRLPPSARIAPMEIDDPNALEKERIVVVRSIARDPLAWMHAHRRIDDAKYLAGRDWQALYERSVLGAIQSVDTTKEPVDGGRWPDPLTQGRALAIRELRRLALLMGPGRNELITDVLGQGLFPTPAARLRGATTDWQIRKWWREFHAGLDTLAVELGYAMPERERPAHLRAA